MISSPSTTLSWIVCYGFGWNIVFRILAKYVLSIQISSQITAAGAPVWMCGLFLLYLFLFYLLIWYLFGTQQFFSQTRLPLRGVLRKIYSVNLLWSSMFCNYYLVSTRSIPFVELSTLMIQYYFNFVIIIDFYGVSGCPSRVSFAVVVTLWTNIRLADTEHLALVASLSIWLLCGNGCGTKYAGMIFSWF